MSAGKQFRANFLAWAPVRHLIQRGWFPVMLQAVVLATFFALVWNGWGVGAGRPAEDLLTLRKTNLTTLLVWGLWWPGMIAVALLFGRAWCTVCPMEQINRAADAVARRIGYTRARLGKLLRSGWFILLAYLLLQILVVGVSVHRVPHYTSLLLVSLLGLALLTGFVFNHPRSFCTSFCPAAALLSVMEYWRWWVVHLWVEGFMEVFATAAMAFIFSCMGLVRAGHAAAAVLASAAIFLVGGIPGTFHHLYFSGTPVSVMAVGASFSALEVVPLALIGFEACETWRAGQGAAWMIRYRWPVRFFLGVAFWNLVGAGVFGFLINPPIALYYMQGLNTTPVHAHAALFGVYGLLALGLTLLVLRRLLPQREWKDGALRFAFWSMNGGLALMIGLSLLPIGLLQAAASMEHGLWYARSAEFLQQPLLETLRWLRMVGDTVFLAGVAALVWFVVGLKTGWSYADSEGKQPALAGQDAALPAAK